MLAKSCFLLVAAALILGVGCSEQSALEPQRTFEPATADVTLRPLLDFLANQGTYCFNDRAGGCEYIDAPVPNYLCWNDADRNLMASLDYAAVAHNWILQESSGGISCGTNCRGQIIEVPQPDGSVRLSVIVETKSALAWADKEAPAPIHFGIRADDVLRGKEAALGYARLETEFSLPVAGAPIPDLMQMLYDPAPGQEVHSIKFQGRAEARVRGKPAILTVVQEGLNLSVPPGRMEDGLPAELKIEVIKNRKGK